MNAEAWSTIAIATVGMLISWAVWVSVSVFKHAQEIALLKMELKVMIDIRDVLGDLRKQLKP